MTGPATEPRGGDLRPSRLRTCVGCGLRDDAGGLVRLVVVAGLPGAASGVEPSAKPGASSGTSEVVFDLAGGAFGRGAHLHATAACVEKAPRGLARAFKGAVKVDAAAVGRRLVDACDRRIAGLLVAARRTGVVTAGADAAFAAMAEGAPLLVVARDAGTIAASAEVARCAAEGRAIAWGTKSELGRLLGEGAVAVCAVRHPGIAGELKRMRVAADAGAVHAGTSLREGAECSRFPEAR